MTITSWSRTSRARGAVEEIGPGRADFPVRAGDLRLARLTGTVNLTVPLATLLGWVTHRANSARSGPSPLYTAREIASAALKAPAVRWCLTVISDNGEPVGHGCARPRVRRRRAAARESVAGESGEWAFTVKLRALAAADCPP